MLADAASGFADRTNRMRCIDQQECTELLLQFDDARERRLIPVHAEHRINRDEDALRATILGLTQTPLEVLHVAVTKATHLGARQAHTLDNALMGILIENGDVACAEQRAD